MNQKHIIRNALNNWSQLPIKTFLKLNEGSKKALVVIKFRDILGGIQICNEVDPFQGVKFIDAMGTDDYFLGEFLVIHKKQFKTVLISDSAIILNMHKRAKFNVKRDDGFLKTYETDHNALVITTI